MILIDDQTAVAARSPGVHFNSHFEQALKSGTGNNRG